MLRTCAHPSINLRVPRVFAATRSVADITFALPELSRKLSPALRYNYRFRND